MSRIIIPLSIIYAHYYGTNSRLPVAALTNCDGKMMCVALILRRLLIVLVPLSSYVVILAAEDSSSQCIANTDLLYDGQDLSDAEATWVGYFQSFCHSWGNSATNGSQCVLADLSTLSSSQLSKGNIQFSQGKFDFTKSYDTNQFYYWNKECTDAGGKVCYSNLDATYKGIIYNTTTFTLPIKYVGFPLCMSNDCDHDSSKRLVKMDAVKYGSFFAGDLLEDLKNATLTIRNFQCGNYTSSGITPMLGWIGMMVVLLSSSALFSA